MVMTTSTTEPSVPAVSSTILVVEDDTLLRGLIHHALESSGYKVLAVADGRAAKRTINETPVHLVVTDIYMADGDGVDLVMHLHATAPKLPVIVMSGGFRGMESSMLRAIRLLGATRTLEKPFSLQTLLDAVRELIGGSASAPSSNHG